MVMMCFRQSEVAGAAFGASAFFGFAFGIASASSAKISLSIVASLTPAIVSRSSSDQDRPEMPRNVRLERPLLAIAVNVRLVSHSFDCPAVSTLEQDGSACAFDPIQRRAVEKIRPLRRVCVNGEGDVL